MLSSGDRLGPYEVVSQLGAGGMGVVYRARDVRLGREVALKVLPPTVAGDAERLRRFELEARAAGALNHPGILAIHDVGSHEGAPYVVSELLEGETLRERLAVGPLPVRKAVDLALQVTRGLAAAHDRQIIHRDLKPENLFLTRDGRAKILDFGLAKTLAPLGAAGSGTGAATASVAPFTEPGVVMGTVGYMSPEQVRGESADARSDLFSFGAVLYEMLGGRRAFQGDSAVDVLHAILRVDPPDLLSLDAQLSPSLDRIVRRCLEKEPDLRFRSAHDLAFALQELSGAAGSGSTLGALPPAPAPRRRSSLRVPAAGLAALALAAGAFLAGGRLARAPFPTFQRLTFQRGAIVGARFAPDGGIVYSAGWGGAPIRLFVARPGSPEALALNVDGAVLAASARELAVARSWKGARGGTLSRVPATGGEPRDLLEDVVGADWSPDGQELAVVRTTNTGSRLEYPIGHVLVESAHALGSPRLSPDGKLIAYTDNPFFGDDRGVVAVTDLQGHARALTREWSSLGATAWGPGQEVWFSAAETGAESALRAVALNGRDRILHRNAGRVVLLDVGPAGRALVAREDTRFGMNASVQGSPERDLSWLDASAALDVSPDGRMLAFYESGEGGGAGYGLYLRKTDGSAPAVRVGEGRTASFSPDGKLLLATSATAPRVSVVPVGMGAARDRDFPQFERIQNADWLADGRRFVFAANEKGHGLRLWLADSEGGEPRPLTPEGIAFLGRAMVTPDRRYIATMKRDRSERMLLEVDGPGRRELPALPENCLPVEFTEDGGQLYCFAVSEVPGRIDRLDLATGRVESWKKLTPADPAGVLSLSVARLTPDGATYAYSYYRTLSDLYLVEGLR